MRTPLVFHLLTYILLALGTLIGGYLMMIGLRGRRHFSEPRCRKCNADLRETIIASGADQPATCPQCGSALSGKNPCYFAWSGRRPGILLVGILSLAGLYYLMAPYLLYRNFGWMRFTHQQQIPSTFALIPMMNTQPMGPPPGPIPPGMMMPAGAMPPGAMIPPGAMPPGAMPPGMRRMSPPSAAYFLPTTQPALTDAEIEQSLSDWIEMHKQLQKRNPPGVHASSRRPRTFRGLGYVDYLWFDRLNEAQLRRLSLAYFGNEPDITLPDKLDAGQPIECIIDYTALMNLGSLKMAYALREVKAGEIVLHLQSRRMNHADPDFLSADEQWLYCTAQGPLPVGTHELTFVVDAGLFANGQPMAGINGFPGQMKHWRNPKTTWTMTVTKTIEVVPASHTTTQPSMGLGGN